MNVFQPGTAAERVHQSRIVAFSSGNVYPLVPVLEGGATESTPPAPVGEYAQSALGRERMLEYFSSRYGTRVTILRLNYAIDLRYGVLLDIGQKVFERRPVNLSETQATTAPEPAPEERGSNRTEPARRQIGSGKALGMLTLNPGPNVPVVYGGMALPRQVGAYVLPVTAQSGSIEVGDDSTPDRVTLDYAVSGAGLNVKLHPAPRAVATVNGKAAAEARIDKTMSVLELKRPGAESGLTVRLLYKAN